MRRISALDDGRALVELDTFCWSLNEAVQHAEDDFGSELGTRMENAEARLREDLARARLSLQSPAGVVPWDAQHIRQSAAVWAKTEAERQEARSLADELDAAYHIANLDRALTEPLASAASLPKHLRMIDTALIELGRLNRLTPALQHRARQGRERLARFRSQRRLEEAIVVSAGGNTAKADKLRHEARALLGIDWLRTFPGEPPPSE